MRPLPTPRLSPTAGRDAPEGAPPGAPSSRRRLIAPTVAFLATGGLLVAYALRGGSYDIVVRQEMGLAIWWVLGLGFALGVLPRAPVPRVRLLGVATLLLVGGWVAIGFGWTESAERTTAELSRIVAYAGVLLLPLALLDRGTWRAAIGGLVHALAAGLGAGAGILAVRDAPRIAHATGSAGAGRVILALVLAALICIAAAGATWALHGERWRLDRRPALALLAGVLVVVAVVGAVALPGPARKAWDQFNEDPFKQAKQSKQQAGAEQADPATHLSTLAGNRRNLW